MDRALIPLLLAMAGRAAEQGTLIEIVETFAKLARLIEPLLTARSGPPASQP